VTGDSAATAPARLRLWDPAIRLFHWALVVLIPAAWWTAEEGDFETHRYIGYALLTLLVFRLLWGVLGSETARFSRFLRGPGAVLQDLKGKGLHAAGHNPLGGWSVLAILALLCTQVGLGLFAVDTDGIESGPLSWMVEFETGRLAAEWHGRVFNAIVAITAVHLAAILFYRFARGQNLTAAMIRGWRLRLPGEAAPVLAPWTRAAGVLLAAGGIVWLALDQWGRGV